MSFLHGRARPPAVGKGIQCPSCGFLQSIPSDTARQAHCQHCASVLELGDVETKVLGRLGPTPEFALSIGAEFPWAGCTYQVAARIDWREADPDPGDFCHEYLLWSPERLPRWLNHERGGWTLWTPTHLGPTEDRCRFHPGDRMRTGDGRAWTCVERGSLQCAYVDGALPWLLAVGASRPYQEFKGPEGALFEIQADGEELDFGLGRKLKDEQIKALLGATPVGPGGSEPDPGVGPILGSMIATGLGSALSYALSSRLAEGAGRSSVTLDWEGPANCGPGGEFEVGSSADAVGFCLSSWLDQQWLAVALEVRSADSVVHRDTALLERWSGVEGGEHWVEDSASRCLYARGFQPGPHAVELCGESGREHATDATPVPPLTLEIRPNTVDPTLLSGAGAILAVLALVNLFALISYASEELGAFRLGRTYRKVMVILAVSVCGGAWLLTVSHATIPKADPRDQGSVREQSSGSRGLRGHFGGGPDFGK